MSEQDKAWAELTQYLYEATALLERLNLTTEERVDAAKVCAELHECIKHLEVRSASAVVAGVALTLRGLEDVWRDKGGAEVDSAEEPDGDKERGGL